MILLTASLFNKPRGLQTIRRTVFVKLDVGRKLYLVHSI